MLRRVRARGLRSPGANREPLVDRVPGKLGPQVSNPRIWCQFTENPTSQALRWRGIAEVRAVTMAAQHFGTLPKTTVSKRKRLLADFSLGQEVASESRHQTAPHPLPRFDCAIGANAGKGCFRTPGSRLSNRCPCDLEKGGNLLPAQRLQVTLSQWPPFGVVASRITVHGVAPVADGSQPPEITKSLGLIPIVDHSTPPHTSNVPHASTETKGAPTGQGQLAALDDILGPLQEPVIVRVSSPDSRWYAWVSGINAINFIELESVSYADGTSWQVSNGKTCRVSVGSSVW